MPRFSVITIVRNDSAGLLRTQASVASQTWRDFEWLIVDGASSDGTAALAMSLATAQTRVVSEPDRGIYDAMNKGLDRATGDYLLFLNAADEFADAGVLQRVARRLAETRADLLYGDSLERYGGLQLAYKTSRGHASVGYGMFGCHQAMYYRRSFIGSQRYDAQFQIAGDYCFTAQVLQSNARVERMHEALCIFDLAGASNVNRRRGRQENWRVQRDVLGLSFARRASIRIRYLLSSFVATRMPGLYKTLRFRNAAP